MIVLRDRKIMDATVLEFSTMRESNKLIEDTYHAGHIQICLDRLRAGDESARDELIHLVCGRMERLARKMLRRFPGVRRWEMTDDVLQNAAIRLYRALKVVTPETARSFFNFAAEQLRRELIDLARHYGGPEGIGARHDSQGGGFPDAESSRKLVEMHETDRLALWTEFHRSIEDLPGQEKEVFNLIWYEGMTQAEAGKVLGIGERAVKWRWRGARLKLQEMLEGSPHRP